MKKNYNPALFESTYKAVMNAIGEEVRSILRESEEDLEECGDMEECDDVEECGDSFDECYESRRPARRNLRTMNEMARSVVKRTINPKSMANVRDAASRRNFDENWATEIKPLAKFDDVELLHRYVAALLVFHKECPQTEEDIDNIGIFKNYAHALIDEGSGTLEDIQTLYNEQDKLGTRSRRGTARGAKGYRANAAATADAPSDNFDFDAEVETPAEEPANEPEQDFPAYDDVPATEEIPEIEDIPDMDDDFSQNDADEDDGEFFEIDNIKSLTREQFEDKKMNRSFIEFNDDYILKNGNQIGFEITIKNVKTDEEQTCNVWADTFAEALVKYNVVLQAALLNISYEFYSVDAANLINVFRKRYMNIIDDDRSEEIDEEVEDFKVSCFDSAKNLDEIMVQVKKYTE